MTNISNFTRNVIAATGSALLTITIVAAAVGPANVHVPAAQYAQASVQASA